MSRRELDVGSFVHFLGVAPGYMPPDASYRIEQLLGLGDGAALYRIRNESEPFDRVVAEHDVLKP